MALKSQTVGMLSKTKDELERLQTLDIASLVHYHPSEKGKKLPDAEEPAGLLVKLYNRIDLDTLDRLPDSILQPLWQHCVQDLRLLNRVQSFGRSEQGDDTENDWESLVGNLIEAYRPTLQKLQIVLVLYPPPNEKVANLVDSATDTLNNTINRVNEREKTFDSEIAKMHEAMNEKAKELDGIVAAAQSTLSKAGVTKQAAYFNTTRKSHKFHAKTWLGVTCVSFLPLLGFSCYVFLNGTVELSPGQSLPLSPTPSEVVLLIGSRVLLFAVLSSLVVVASRNYFAHRHNAVVNEHRTNALNTYQVLARATDDDLERDKILTMAASAIFSPQSSGYGKEGLSKTPSSSSIVGLVTDAAKGSTKGPTDD